MEVFGVEVCHRDQYWLNFVALEEGDNDDQILIEELTKLQQKEGVDAVKVIKKRPKIIRNGVEQNDGSVMYEVWYRDLLTLVEIGRKLSTMCDDQIREHIADEHRPELH